MLKTWITLLRYKRGAASFTVRRTLPVECEAPSVIFERQASAVAGVPAVRFVLPVVKAREMAKYLLEITEDKSVE